MMRIFFIAPAVAFALVASGAALKPVPSILSPAAEAGRQAFRDARLSASGKMSCASCHAPEHAFAQPNGFAVQKGGPRSDRPGTRTVPSLLYQRFTPAFHFAAPGTAVGGFNRDGRATSLGDQAAIPLMSPFEMAAPSREFLRQRLARAPYAGALHDAFGAHVLDGADAAFRALTLALEAYQRESREFAPFASKFDDYLSGHAALAPAEARGLALFNDPAKGNCAACHLSARGRDGTPPLFTDFGFHNLGVPRNMNLPSTKDPTRFDLGLCGPDRRDLAHRKDLCGAFKTPTLRNAATRQVFFHNGFASTLEAAIAFHVRRDTSPGEWYPARQFDDMPAELAFAVDTRFAHAGADGVPRLTAAEIADIATFIKALDDDPRPR
ncbi:MAG: cytochrome c peroxidase [Alphaproteobacteria bacterium]